MRKYKTKTEESATQNKLKTNKIEIKTKTKQRNKRERRIKKLILYNSNFLWLRKKTHSLYSEMLNKNIISLFRISFYISLL